MCLCLNYLCEWYIAVHLLPFFISFIWENDLSLNTGVGGRLSTKSAIFKMLATLWFLKTKYDYNQWKSFGKTVLEMNHLHVLKKKISIDLNLIVK